MGLSDTGRERVTGQSVEACLLRLVDEQHHFLWARVCPLVEIWTAVLPLFAVKYQPHVVDKRKDSVFVVPKEPNGRSMHQLWKEMLPRMHRRSHYSMLAMLGLQ